MSDTNDGRRAEAWKEMALGVRKLFGDLCELSGAVCGVMEAVADFHGKDLPPDVADRIRTASAELLTAVTSMRLPVPRCIAHEVRAADKAEAT